jgi:PKD repeat protein
VNAYAKPVCLEIFDFPVCNYGTCAGTSLSREGRFIPNDPPEAACQNVEAFTNLDSGCRVDVEAIAVDNGSSDPNLDKIFYKLDKAGPFSTGTNSVTLTVTDIHGALDECTATITVTDSTPSSIMCPVGTSQSTDDGQCNALVVYEEPLVTDNCVSSSTLTQIEGSQSGSIFQVGSTENVFKIEDSLGNANQCSFIVSVFDDENPVISCDGLAVTVPTDPGSCTARYEYVPPVATDNCEASTVLTQSPEFDPFLFPVEASNVQYTGTDFDGNEASCSFVVMVEDREPPSIACPSEDIRFCDDIDPDQTGRPETSDNCEVEVVVFSDKSDDGIAGVCPEITTRTWTSTDVYENSASCVQKIIEVGRDAVTSGSLCMFDVDESLEKQQFRVTFTPDGNNRPNYKLTATNPGQFYYNLFHVGEAGSLASLSLEVPYPFVTQGANPVHAYEWFDLVAGPDLEPCFVPEKDAILVDSTQIVLSDYASATCGDFTTINFDVVVPESGVLLLHIHLDYGLKGIGNVAIGANNKAVDASTGALIFESQCPLSFSVTGNAPSKVTTVVENLHVFKRNPGVAGLVFDEFLNPPHDFASYTVALLTSGGILVKPPVLLDQDGYYEVLYKHKGRATAYTIELRRQDINVASKLVLLKGNGFDGVDFAI